MLRIKEEIFHPTQIWVDKKGQNNLDYSGLRNIPSDK